MMSNSTKGLEVLNLLYGYARHIHPNGFGYQIIDEADFKDLTTALENHIKQALPEIAKAEGYVKVSDLKMELQCIRLDGELFDPFYAFQEVKISKGRLLEIIVESLIKRGTNE